MTDYSLDSPPAGVINTRKQTEYQYFPEDYFSGSDVTVYFGDVWADDIVSLSFTLEEKVLPIYGYASYTYDEVARGNRLVSGQFTVAFKEVGWLYTILDHVASVGDYARPELAYLATGETANMPAWTSPIKERIEDALDILFNDPTKNKPDTTVQDSRSHKGDWKVPMKMGMKDADVGLSNYDMHNYKATGKGCISEMQDHLFNKLNLVVQPTTFNWDMSQMVQKYDDNNQPYGGVEHIYESVAQMRQRLASPIWRSFQVDDDVDGWDAVGVRGKFGTYTKSTLMKFQAFAGLTPTGSMNADTKRFLEMGTAVVNNSWVTGDFDFPTKLALAAFQKSKGVTPNGIMDDATADLMVDSYSRTVPGATAMDPSKLSENKYTEQENEIWGRRFLDTSVSDYRNRTYFYQKGETKKLRATGYDIYITYGPINEDVKILQNANKGYPDMVKYNTTVKAIRGIQLTGVTQQLNPDGNPIYETYSFISSDID